MTLDWVHVARRVKRRRLALGINQDETEEVSPATWNKIENAKEQSYKDFTLARIERALFWPPGFIMRLAEGEDPEDPEANESEVSRLRAEVAQLRRELEALRQSEGKRPDGPRGAGGSR